MLYSQLFGRSSKTEGKNLDIKSHRLLVQAGFIRESVAGRYYFLPLGQKVQLKLIDLIRHEMNLSGAQEVLAPILHPLKLWQETHRDQAAGFELMQLSDRRGAGFALGGTAEEMLVDLVRKFNFSYKDLPFNLYQFGLKFRDELRARGGLLRVREFIMKDAYSFSKPEQFEEIYQTMWQTYQRIFTKIGLTTKVIEADGGYIGGQYCHEFVVPAPVGESLYFYTKAGYLAHEDVAVFDKTPPTKTLQPALGLKKVKTVRGPTMADSLKSHQPKLLIQHIKNVVFINEKKQIILACLRGDLDVNEVKLQKLVNCHQLTPLDESQIKGWLKSYPGFISPVNLKPAKKSYQPLIVVDDSLENLTNLISGANELNYDYININLKRDFQFDLMGDIALAQTGFKALDGQTLKAEKGIEVGNIFQLGYHYSKAMAKAEYVDEKGKLQKYYMGCYGIGIGRTLAAVAEVLSDEAGLVWPRCLAPYDIYLLVLGQNKDNLKLALKLKKELQTAGLEVLYDDRLQVSGGEKLANADLLGFPLRLVISDKTMALNQVEFKLRSTNQIQLVNWDLTTEKALYFLKDLA